MITVTDLRKVYQQGKKEVVALDGVTLSVPKGSIHGIIGHSGAGKSTLVRCLTLLDRPTSGSVSIDGTGAQLRPGLGDPCGTAPHRHGLPAREPDGLPDRGRQRRASRWNS